MVGHAFDSRTHFQRRHRSRPHRRRSGRRAGGPPPAAVAARLFAATRDLSRSRARSGPCREMGRRSHGPQLLEGHDLRRGGACAARSTSHRAPRSSDCGHDGMGEHRAGRRSHESRRPKLRAETLGQSSSSSRFSNARSPTGAVYMKRSEQHTREHAGRAC